MWNPVALMAERLSWGERASTAGIVTLQGMLTVFAVLAVLWGVIELMHRLLHKEKKAPSEAEQGSEAVGTAAAFPVPNAEDAAVAAAIAASLAAYEDNGATVAAITAAISATLAEEGYTGGFRVVSFKRAETAHTRKKY